MSAPRRILVVRAGALGDTLMVTPLLRALREKFENTEIDFVSSRLAADVLALAPRIGRRFSLRYRNLPYSISLEKRKLVRELRARDYDFAVLLERAAHYRLLLERAEIQDVRSFRETPFDPRAHAIVNNLRAAGFEERGARLDMEVFLSEDDRVRATALSSGIHRPKIGIHVGYGPRGKKRNQSERLKGWSSGSFTELAAVIQSLDVLVSVDSGPAHLAAAVGTPLVVLWGPAILEQVRPLSSRSPVTLLRHPPPCAPCYETPLMKTCPRNVCMESITPREVLASVEALLDRGENPTSPAQSTSGIPPTR